MHLHGSLILQQLLHYNKPIKLVRSCLQLPAAQLAQLLADPRGCHVTDSFMSRSGLGNTLISSLTIFNFHFAARLWARRAGKVW